VAILELRVHKEVSEQREPLVLLALLVPQVRQAIPGLLDRMESRELRDQAVDLVQLERLVQLGLKDCREQQEQVDSRVRLVIQEYKDRMEDRVHLEHQDYLEQTDNREPVGHVVLLEPLDQLVLRES